MSLPVSSLFRKLSFATERERRRQGEWIRGLWARVRAEWHTLIQDKDLPPASKEDAEKKPNWGKIAEARRWREKHDHEFQQALLSPRHFGAWVQMPDILGPPDPETVKTIEEVRAEQQERNERLPEEAKIYFLNDSILARAAREGRMFAPAD